MKRLNGCVWSMVRVLFNHSGRRKENDHRRNSPLSSTEIYIYFSRLDDLDGEGDCVSIRMEKPLMRAYSNGEI